MTNSRDKEQREFEESLFHIKNLTAKRCVRFFGDSEDEDSLCTGCQYPVREHRGATNGVPLKPWTRDTSKWKEDFCIYNIDKRMTGKIRFLNEVENIDKIANFAVLANNTSPSTVVREILMQEFKVSLPNLVIAFAGSHSKVQITEERQMARFKQGFLNAATSTRSWILTGGTTLGIDGYITDLLKERIYQEWIGVVNRTFNLIGIANWNCVDQHEQMLHWYIKHHKLLEAATGRKKRRLSAKRSHSMRKTQTHLSVGSDDGNDIPDPNEELAYPYRCKLTKSIPKSAQNYSYPLNPQNINLILADCGIKDRQGHEVGIRSDVETFISNENGLNTPTVLILVGGSYNCFERAARALSNSIPVVVCEGSGDAADILTLAIKLHITNSKHMLHTLTPHQCHKIAAMMERKFHNTARSKKHNQLFSMESFQPAMYLHYIAECCRKKDLVVIYKIDDPDCMLDEAILKALFCVTKKGTDNLQLAMEWGRCDENVRMMLSREADINFRPNIKTLIMKAFREEKLEFIKTFMEYGLDMKAFLKPSVLAELYQDTCYKYPPFLKLLRNATGIKEEYSINDVYTVIKKRTSASMTHKIKFIQGRRGATANNSHSFMYRRNKNTKVLFEDPFMELALWSVFSNRLSSAKFYWERSNCQLMLALIISELWRVLSTAVPPNDSHTRATMIHNEQMFNEMANDILTVCSHNNQELCQQLLLYKDDFFGMQNCIDIAGYCDAKNFIANPAVQVAINNQWKNTLRCSSLDIVLGLLFPPYIAGIEYDKSATHLQYDPADDDDTDINMSHPQLRRGGVMSATQSVASFLQQNQNNGGNCSPPPPALPKHSHVIEMGASIAESTGVASWKTRTLLASRGRKMSTFLNAPITKFVIHTSAYVVFLVLFTYYFLFKIDTARDINRYQVMQIFFLVSHALDEVCQLVLDKAAWSLKMRLWLKSEWNVINLIYISVGLVAFPVSLHPSTIHIARVMYGPVVFLVWLRLLRFYQVSPKLGPIWIMIRKMLVETLIFLSVFLLVIIACGIIIFLYNVNVAGERPYTDYQWLLLRPFFMSTSGHTFHKTVTEGDMPFLTQVVIVCFMFLGNALILNLLVALFGSVYNSIMSNSSTEWKYEMYWMLEEYKKKTFFPPPFSIIERILQLFQYFREKSSECFLKMQGKSNVVSMGIVKDGTAGTEPRILKQFESFCTYESIRQKAKSISTAQYVEKLLVLEEDQTRRIKDCASNLSLCRITVQNNLELRQKRLREKKIQRKNRETAGTASPDSPLLRSNLTPLNMSMSTETLDSKC